MLIDLYGGRKAIRHYFLTGGFRKLMLPKLDRLDLAAGLDRKPAYPSKVDPRNERRRVRYFKKFLEYITLAEESKGERMTGRTTKTMGAIRSSAGGRA